MICLVSKFLENLGKEALSSKDTKKIGPKGKEVGFLAIHFDVGDDDFQEISSLSVEPCEGETLIVTVFEIQKSEISAFMERELEFHFLAVLPETLHGEPFGHPAVSVLGIVMKNFSKSDGKEARKIYFQHYG
ncbi:hypothetical protein SLEP1_g40113 [Rubroshorea leprosula]|uniref:Uncharacterized protein n=1 Tax=Rubroshorea leprosula TaxID=152421 RepID=A0AAV5L2N6_9ROSI|nr:hypothetical protein SLEP1_g40113 [Rubroshorea leprosula]